MVSFENTEVALADLNDRQLEKAFFLFKIVKFPFLVKSGSLLVRMARFLKIPLKWAIGKAFFEHFCGGETLEQCTGTIQKFASRNISTVLDYAAEGIQSEVNFDMVTQRIISGIEFSNGRGDIAFAVFKFTGIARFALLEKISNGLTLTADENAEYERVYQRADQICNVAIKHNLPVMIDAEESWIQNAIDAMAEELMAKYNSSHPYVYNTLQLYRIDKLYYLKQMHKIATDEKFFPAFKIVRGAYLEKERERAMKLGYKSPVHPDKITTDKAFDDAVRFCLENIANTAVCIGTHNEESCLDAMFHMDRFEIPNNHPRVHFSQLMGMSDHISYNLAREGYNVSKYVPYGPIDMVIPYLIRRAEENTSVSGQTGRELYLIKKEIKRRKALSSR
jgi:proline dehydrogenase